MSITPERWQQVKQILAKALDVDSGRQQEFLDFACGSDSGLRAEVESLLAHRVETSSDVIEMCASDAARFRVKAEPSRAGTRIGAYRVVREIGHGGMGAVFLAVRDDEQYQQQVAIKLIKSNIADDAMRRRFRNEMQILADLNHPSIARLFDAGQTEDGVPYLVMEYVEGQPINVYCEEQDVSTEQRLRLFCMVCEAVQYAHQHLVIHRDIKPGNILVTNEGVPKLVDFGIAKLLDRSNSAEATVTAIQFMTPQYASPEQILGGSVTTATDVYSLGVVLYELLSGQLPYRLKSRLPHEVAKAICDQDPQRPSAAIVQTNGGEPSASIGTAVRSHTSRRKRLHSDLDNIVLMAMRKEPERRYPTAEQLADDIRRHLNGLPVRARADTFTYRTGKFIRRQKVAVTAALLIALTLIFGIIATLSQNRVARAERARAERRFSEVRQLANSFVFEVHDSIANLPGSTEARSLIVQRGLKYLDSLAQDAAGDRELQRELAVAYEKLGTVQYTPTVAHLGDLAGALDSHRKAAALREALVAAEPNNLNYRRDLLDSYWFIATLLGAQGDLPRELQILREQLPARRELAAAEKTEFVDRYNLAGTYAYIGSLLMEMGDVNGALTNQREALKIREELSALDPNHARANRALTISYEFIGVATERAGDTKVALDLQLRGLKLRESLVANDPLNTDLRLMLIESHRYVGDVLFELGDKQQAAVHYQKQLALNEEMIASDPTNAQFKSNHAVALIKVGDVEAHADRAVKALESYKQALRLREQLSSSAPTDTTIRRDLAEALIKVGDALAIGGQKSQALENYLKGLEILKTLSSAIPAHAGVRGMLAQAYVRVGQMNFRIASETSTLSKRVEYLRDARSAYQQTLDITTDMRNRQLVSPATLDFDVNDTASEISKIDALLNEK
ncbi:MAG TPA: protein kinase [Pyrinomonadaceae bacterium]|nr:protein kinase [Pyrinomonadaceae bacterium]